MKVLEVAAYLSGMDYIEQHRKKQKRMMVQGSGTLEPVLPIEAGFKTAARVYADRLRTVFEYPFILASRLTGIDAAIKIAKKSVS